MKYRTQFDEHKSFHCDCGCPIYDKYALDKDGDPFVVSTHNRYDEIQSHRASCELATLLERYSNGDLSALNQNVPISGDFADAPSNLQEWFERYKQASSDFYGLPEGLRAIFNNNPAEFWSTFGSAEFDENVNAYRQTLTEPKPGNTGDPSTDPLVNAD